MNFEPPKIIGALCDREMAVPAGLRRALKKAAPGFVILPFKVDAKYLKNTIACMRLMDIAGLFVMGGHRKRIGRHLDSAADDAKKGGYVDCVQRRGNRFVGRCAKMLAKNGGAFYSTCAGLLTADIASKKS